AGLDLDRLLSVEGLEWDDRAQGGRGHGNGQRAVQIVTATLEHLVLALADLDVQVALGSTGNASITHLRHADARAGLDTRGNVDVDGVTRMRATTPGAFGARGRDGGAIAAARGAWRGGHDVAKERSRHALQRSGAIALAARLRRGPRGAAAAVARGTLVREIHGDGARDTEHGLLKRDLFMHERVAAALHARCGAAALLAAAKERLENVLEAKALRAARRSARRTRIHTTVVLGTLVSVAKIGRAHV